MPSASACGASFTTLLLLSSALCKSGGKTLHETLRLCLLGLCELLGRASVSLRRNDGLAAPIASACCRCVDEDARGGVCGRSLPELESEPLLPFRASANAASRLATRSRSAWSWSPPASGGGGLAKTCRPDAWRERGVRGAVRPRSWASEDAG